MLKRPEFPDGFQGRKFKDKVPDQLIDVLLIGCWEVTEGYIIIYFLTPTSLGFTAVLVISMLLFSSIW